MKEKRNLEPEITHGKAFRGRTTPHNLVDYQQLFQNSLEAILIVAPVLDNQGRLIDALVQDANPTFCELAGIRRRSACGKLVTHLFPDVPDLRPIYRDLATVAAGGRAQRREIYYAPLDRYFTYQMFTLKPGQIAIIGLDITPQKQAIQALNENQQRLNLSEELAIQRTAQVEVQHKMIESFEMERLHIANQLHEGLLQSLIGVRYALEEGLGVDQKEIRLAKLAAVQATLQREIRRLRDFCNELRPPTLASFGLEKTIRSYVESYHKKQPQLNIQLELSPDGQRLPQQVRLVLFRAFQELFKMTILRPGACNVLVRLKIQEDHAELEIVDPLNAANLLFEWAEMARLGNIGLASALERVEAMEGRLQVESLPDQGTKLKVTVPVKIV